MPKPNAGNRTPTRRVAKASLQEKQEQRALLRASSLDHNTPEGWKAGGAGNKVQRLDYDEIENAVLKDPLVGRGVWKKARDTLRRWHSFEAKDGSDNPDPALVARLEEFSRRVNLPHRTMMLMADTLLYGDGYLEVVRRGDTAPANLPPNGDGGIKELVTVAPPTMRRKRVTLADAEMLAAGYNYGDLVAFEQQVEGQTFDIHPSRIRHLQFYDVGDDPRGLGAVERAYFSIKSKIRGDLSLGDYVAWHAKGLVHTSVGEATVDDVNNTYTELMKAKKQGDNILVTSDRIKAEIHKAGQFDPATVYDQFHFNLAAALDMPKDTLIGATGASSQAGSKTNERDYTEDNASLLFFHFTPLLEDLYATELGISRDELPVRIKWHPLFSDEEAAAKTRFTEAQAATLAYRDGIVTLNEARRRMGFDPVDAGDGFIHEVAGFEPTEAPAGMPPAAKDTQSDPVELAADDVAQFYAWQAQAERERELGRQILDEGGAA